jgi:hypothetical protein
MIPVNAAVLIALFLLGPARLWRDTLAVSLGGLGLCCAGVFLLLTNWQFYQLPLNAVAAILIMDRLVSQPGVSYVPLRIGVLMLGIALLVSSESMDVRGFAYGLTQRAFGTTPYVSFDAPRLAGLVSYENGGDVPYVRDYAEQVNDGMSLLKGHLRPNDTLVSLDYSNTFSYALGVKPALGGATWLSYGNNFDEVHPGAERLFGNSSLAIVPRIRDVDSVQASIQIAIRRVYGPFLVQHFQLVGESTHWQLYRRRATNVP